MAEEFVRAKNFLKHLSLAAKKLEDRELAKYGLSKHIERMKNLPARDVKKGRIEKELKILENKISQVLEKEAAMAQSQVQETQTIKGLKDMIMELENKLAVAQRERDSAREANRITIARMGNMMSEMNEKLNRYIEHKTARERKMEALESKIKEQVKGKVQSSRGNIDYIKQQLDGLEKRYEQMISDKIHSPENLQRLKRKIDFLKNQAGSR